MMNTEKDNPANTLDVPRLVMLRHWDEEYDYESDQDLIKIREEMNKLGYDASLRCISLALHQHWEEDYAVGGMEIPEGGHSAYAPDVIRYLNPA